MLSQLRQNTKTILWVVIVAFVGLIFVVWGMNLRRSGGPEAGFIGRVGRDRITLEEYRSELANQRAAYYESSGQRPGMQAEKQIGDLAWEMIVQRHLLWGEATKQRFLATDDEVLMELRTNPPPFIRAQPVFQTDSVYDHSKYLQALSDPNIDFSFLEAYVRSTLPLQKLQDYVASTVRVTDEEVRLLSRMLQETVTISYVAVDPLVDVTETIPEPTEPELSAYYSGHLEDFRIAEKRTLEYVEVVKRPSAEDERYAREKIEEAFDLIDAGEPFPEIAAEYSDDERSRASGGDLGWVRRGGLPDVLDSVAAGLESGRMSGIIRTDEGFHIVRVDDRRETDGIEEIKISHILSALEPSPLTIEKIGGDAAEMASAAGRKGLDEAAAEEGYEATRSEELTSEEVAPRFMIGAEDAERVFAARRGDIVGPVEGVGSFYVFEIAEIIPSSIPSLDDIAVRVRRAYSYERKRQSAQAIADEIVDAVSRGVSLENAAEAKGLRTETASAVSRMSNVPRIGSGNVVIAQAFTLKPSETSNVIEHGGRFYIMRVDERNELANTDFAADLQNLKLSLLGTKQRAFMEVWYEALKRSTQIDDYRTLGSAY